MDYEQKQCLLKFFRCYTGQIDGIWGSGSVAATKLLQTRCGLRADGIFGEQTEAEVRTLIGSGAAALPEQKEDWWQEIRYFSPEEFRCKCHKATKYCDGWPYPMQKLVVQILDRARSHFRQPITVISGLRCQQHNTAVGGVPNSQHQFGEAADIYVWGTDPETVLLWFQSQPDVRYAYRIQNSDNIHFDIANQGREAIA